MKEIGRFIKEKWSDRGLSLREASRLSGVSHTHIRDIEDGRSIPSFAMVMNFIKAYTVDIEDFLRETGYLPANAEPEHMGDIKAIYGCKLKFLLYLKWKQEIQGEAKLRLFYKSLFLNNKKAFEVYHGFIL